jgi:hypothetical protein
MGDIGMDFAGTLRQAIRASGLTLDRLRHRLDGQGVQVSVATLSYWQRGRSRPGSRAAVQALEVILGLSPGVLTRLLDEQAGRTPIRRTVADLWPDPELFVRALAQLDRSGDHRLERLSLHDICSLDENLRPRTLAVREVLRASGDDIDRVIGVHQVDSPGAPPVLGGLRYCRPGRVRTEAGLVAFELFLDRVLMDGETAVVEYELRFPENGPVGRHYGRRFPHPVRDYLVVMRFHPEAFPSRCHRYSQDTDAAPRKQMDELWIGTSGSAHFAISDVPRGIIGIEWERN